MALAGLRNFILALSLFCTSALVSAQYTQGAIVSPANGTAIAPGEAFNFDYQPRGDYGISSFNMTVWLFTGPPDTSSFSTFLTGYFFGRWSTGNIYLNGAPYLPPPAQLSMPDFSQDHGFAYGLEASNVPLYFVVLEEYGTFTHTLGLDISFAYSTIIYNATEGGGGGTSTNGTSTIRPGNDQSVCLTAGADSNGAQVTIEACSGASNQQWSYGTVPGSTTISIYGGALCLDVTNGSTANGNLAQVWSCSEGDANQQWYVTSDNRIAWENEGECLDLTNGDTTAGNVIQLWTCTSDDDFQVWNFV